MLRKEKMKKIYNCVVVMWILGVIAISCLEIDKSDSIANINIELEKSIDVNQELDSMKWIRFKEVYKELSDEIMRGDLRVSTSMGDSPEYELNTIDWNMQVGEVPRSYQLNLQSLNPVLFLTATYEENGNIEYLEHAHDILKSWIVYDNDTELKKNNEYVWDSHAMAMRAENLVYFAYICEKANFLTDEDQVQIDNLIIKHGTMLSSQEQYHENHNHGVVQDRALLVVSYYLNSNESDKYITTAKDRLEKQWDFEFTDKMVSTENSFGYQVFNHNLYTNIIEYLIAHGDNWGVEKQKQLKLSDDVIGWMLKPNNYSSLHGESSMLYYDSQEGASGSTLEYITSNGEKGIKPIVNSIIFEESGYYIFREDWEITNTNGIGGNQDSVWTMFKSGFQSIVHKQDDDNSFQYYAKGHDVFVDPGFFGYVSNDLRFYLTSAQGHNAVSVDGKTYQAKKAEIGKAGIIYNNLSEEKSYDYIIGMNNYFENVKLKRHFINMRESFIIVDECESTDNHLYTQNFQLGPYISIIEHSKNEILMKIADTNYFVRIQQLSEVESVEVLVGEEGTDYGQYSPKVYENEYITTLRFNQYGENVTFNTLITVENELGENIDFDECLYDDITKEFKIINKNNEKDVIKIQ